MLFKCLGDDGPDLFEIDLAILGKECSEGGLFGEGAAQVVGGLEFVDLGRAGSVGPARAPRSRRPPSICRCRPYPTACPFCAWRAWCGQQTQGRDDGDSGGRVRVKVDREGQKKGSGRRSAARQAGPRRAPDGPRARQAPISQRAPEPCGGAELAVEARANPGNLNAIREPGKGLMGPSRALCGALVRPLPEGEMMEMSAGGPRRPSMWADASTGYTVRRRVPVQAWPLPPNAPASRLFSPGAMVAPYTVTRVAKPP